MDNHSNHPSSSTEEAFLRYQVCGHASQWKSWTLVRSDGIDRSSVSGRIPSACFHRLAGLIGEEASFS